MSDPITDLCESAMRGFADASARALPTSPLARVRATLGPEQYSRAAADALRRHLKRELLAAIDQHGRDGRMPSDLEARTLITAVVADAIRDIVGERS